MRELDALKKYVCEDICVQFSEAACKQCLLKELSNEVLFKYYEANGRLPIECYDDGK